MAFRESGLQETDQWSSTLPHLSDNTFRPLLGKLVSFPLRVASMTGTAVWYVVTFPFHWLGSAATNVKVSALSSLSNISDSLRSRAFHGLATTWSHLMYCPSFLCSQVSSGASRLSRNAQDAVATSAIGTVVAAAVRGGSKVATAGAFLICKLISDCISVGSLCAKFVANIPPLLSQQTERILSRWSLITLCFRAKWSETHLGCERGLENVGAIVMASGIDLLTFISSGCSNMLLFFGRLFRKGNEAM